MTVWAKALPTARQRNSMRTAARADEVLVAMIPLLQDWLRLAPAEIAHGQLVTRARHIVGDKAQSDRYSHGSSEKIWPVSGWSLDEHESYPNIGSGIVRITNLREERWTRNLTAASSRHR